MKDQLIEPVLVETLPSGIEIWFVALVEYTPIYDNLFEEDEAKEIAMQIDNYELVYFCAKVYAELEGIELAESYLGCCILEDYEEFYTKYKSDYYSDMAREVEKEAIEELKRLKKVFNQITL